MTTRPQNHDTTNHPTTAAPRHPSKDLARPSTRSQRLTPSMYKYKVPVRSPFIPPPMSQNTNVKQGLPHPSTPLASSTSHLLKKTASSSSLKTELSHTALSNQPGEVPAPAVPQSKQAFQDFREEWAKLLYEGHPNRQIGLDILDNLIADPRVSLLANSKLSYPRGGDPRLQPDLARLIQIDLDQINLEDAALLQSQGCQRPLGDSADVRSAVSVGAPIAISLPCTPLGSCARPILQLDGYKIDKFSRSSFAVSGTFVVESPKHSDTLVFTQAVGQCIVIHWADVPENRMGPPTGVNDMRKLVEWAVAQPYLAVQILRPGEHALIQPNRTRFTIALGYQNSNFSAALCMRIVPDNTASHWSSALHHGGKPPPAKQPAPHSAQDRAPKRARVD